MGLGGERARMDRTQPERRAQQKKRKLPQKFRRARHFGLTVGRAPDQRAAQRNRSALPITDTELKLIAAAAMIGLSNTPKKG